ncbi:MAG: DUF2497 domain-containing protein [Alphaproteobacteria bacterium]
MFKKQEPMQYFRQEENYIGDEKPIIMVDKTDGESDAVIDISDPSQTDTNDGMKEIISQPLNNNTAQPASGGDLIGDEWLNSSEIVSDNARALSESAINQVRQAIRDRGIVAGGINIGRGDITIEQIVRESVRPYLKSWVDHNLESIVKEVMRREMARFG